MIRHCVMIVCFWSVMMCAATLAPPAHAQGTAADYERAARLRNTWQGKVFGDSVTPNWLEDGTSFWYRVQRRSGEVEFVLVDAQSGAKSPLFDAARLAAALHGETGRAHDASRLPIERLIVLGESITFLLRDEQRIWNWDRSKGALQIASDEQAKVFEIARAEREAGGANRRGRGARATIVDGRETAIIFRNRTNERVLLFWLAGENDRRPYGEIAPGTERRQHTFSGHRWVVTDAAGNDLQFFTGENEPAIAVIERSTTPTVPAPITTSEIVAILPQRAPQTQSARRGTHSPDGRWSAFVRDRNLYLIASDNDAEIALSADGTDADGFDGRIFWSPDSTKLLAMRGKPGDDRRVHYVEAAPRDQLQPKLHSYAYLKPGDNVPQYWPRLFDVAAQVEITVDRTLCPNPYALNQVRWNADSRGFTFMYNQRGHQALRWIEVDAQTGASRAIINEESATFIHYSGKMFLHRVESTGEAIWMSERDGWNHLYLYDIASGAVKNQITRGQWVVRAVDRVDDQARHIWFRVSGIHPNQDPYHVHFARINFDGSGLTLLTESDGTHEVEYSPDRKWLIARWSRVDHPPVTELRKSDDGSLVCVLESADSSALEEAGWTPPQRFVAKGRDGVTDIYGILIRPSNFDPAKRYPVIENIYAGPHDSHVPKNFRTWYGSQEIGELGFIMVHIDGMGTSNRGKAFHDVCWMNLADAGLPDRIAWIKAAAAEHPEMDISRVGIYGGSAGGQNALGALLLHGDFYKAAAADCGCHDNRMDKIWWNEQWMGWPVGDHYAQQSNVTLAKHLTGKLLLTVGEKDENVDPASTMQVADALIRANKDFELLVIPGAGHGAGETPYARRKRQDFFVRYLLGVEPRAE